MASDLMRVRSCPQFLSNSRVAPPTNPTHVSPRSVYLCPSSSLRSNRQCLFPRMNPYSRPSWVKAPILPSLVHTASQFHPTHLHCPCRSPHRRLPTAHTHISKEHQPQVTTTHFPSSRSPEVELRNINLSFGKKQVLRNLNLKIFRGESTAIIGTSGTGKSTALRVICGLTVPNSGDVILRGWKRTKSIAMEKGKSRVSMVFQNAALFDSLTVGENVGFSLLRERRVSEQRIYELVKMFLKRVDMDGSMDMMPEQLSGGMRKRVGLARAIIYDPDVPETAPDILLYDEPTAGLDPTSSTRIENLIRNVQDVCPTCIVVTHQFSTIRRVADRVVMMHEGSVVWDGRVEELDTTDNLYVRQFMSGSAAGPLTSEDDFRR